MYVEITWGPLLELANLLKDQETGDYRHGQTDQ